MSIVSRSWFPPHVRDRLRLHSSTNCAATDLSKAKISQWFQMASMPIMGIFPN